MRIKAILVTLLLLVPAASYADSKLDLEAEDISLFEAWMLLKNYCGDAIAEHSFLHPNRSVTLSLKQIDCKEAAIILKDYDMTKLQDGKTPSVNSGTDIKKTES